MLPPWEYARAALAAELHVQIAIDRVEPPATTPGAARIHGTVIRVFRGGPALVGTRIATQLDCLEEGDDAPPSGTIWFRVASIKNARVLEAFLNRSDAGYEVALWNAQILQAPTDSPAMVFTPAEANPTWHGTDSKWSLGTLLAALPAVLFIGAGFFGLAYALWVLLH